MNSRIDEVVGELEPEERQPAAAEVDARERADDVERALRLRRRIEEREERLRADGR